MLRRTPFVPRRPKVTAAERHARKVVRARSGGRCERCGRPATNFHHRKPRSLGGQWDPANLLHLCGSGSTGCHGEITEPTSADVERQGWTVPSHRDPAQVPAWLYGREFCYLTADGSIEEIEEEAS